MEPSIDPADNLIAVLPAEFYEWIRGFDLSSLVEIVLDYGRPVELRFSNREPERSQLTVTDADLKEVVGHPSLGNFGQDNRAGISGTLHRISRIQDRNDETIGLTLRCGRVIESSIELIADLLDTGQGILFVGAPGSGKTSLVRQACRYLSDGADKRVMIVDTSMEIAGDGKVPHEAVGSSRRIPVKSRGYQFNTMLEAVQNHTPEVLAIDEIGTREESRSCVSISERGVQLIASAHGRGLESILRNGEIKDMLGKVDTAAVSDKNAEREGSKFVTKRLNDPAFQIVVEVLGFGKLAVHHDVCASVDAYLAGETLRPEHRWIGADGEVCKRQEMTEGALASGLKSIRLDTRG